MCESFAICWIWSFLFTCQYKMRKYIFSLRSTHHRAKDFCHATGLLTNSFVYRDQQLGHCNGQRQKVWITQLDWGTKPVSRDPLWHSVTFTWPVTEGPCHVTCRDRIHLSDSRSKGHSPSMLIFIIFFSLEYSFCRMSFCCMYRNCWPVKRQANS